MCMYINLCFLIQKNIQLKYQLQNELIANQGRKLQNKSVKGNSTSEVVITFFHCFEEYDIDD